MKLTRWMPMALIGLCLASASGKPATAAAGTPAKGLASALSPDRWSQVQDSVDRSLAWLALQQSEDGSFPSLEAAQPAITSLCVMAFLSRGHQPGFGPYGKKLDRAVEYVLSCQRDDGLFSRLPPEPEYHDRKPSQTASYNHAIAGLMLGEVYGHASGKQARTMKTAIAKAIQFSRDLQTRPKPYSTDEGGWRYLRIKASGDRDADMSITAWHLMFLRSAKNAEFNVPHDYMDAGLEFVRRCWDSDTGMFNYLAHEGGGIGASRGLTGAGIVSLSMAGQHNTPMAQAAGQWLAEHPFTGFGQTYGPWDKFYYSAYYCSQAGAQLGGHFWEKIYPPLVNVLISIQEASGAFPPEPRQNDSVFGRDYSTAMAVLALTPAYQLLPVYQR